MNEKPVLCHICGQPVDLTLGTVADEKGRSVHEECYVRKVVSPNDKREAPGRKSAGGPLSLPPVVSYAAGCK